MKMDTVNLLTCECVWIHKMDEQGMASEKFKYGLDKSLEYTILNTFSLCYFDVGSLKNEYSLNITYSDKHSLPLNTMAKSFELWHFCAV